MARKKKKPEWESSLNDDSDAKEWKDESELIEGAEPKKKAARDDDEDDLGEIADDYGTDDSDDGELE